MRDARTRSGIEVFMVRRHGQSGFMAGAHVFPGGKLDQDDTAPRLLARVQGRSTQGAARALDEEGEGDSQRALGLFVAAIRETFEEAGVLLADLADDVDAAALTRARQRMHDGAAFVDVVEALDATLRADRLVPCSRWITPEVEPRRYDTRFLLARVPDSQPARADRRETTEAAWLHPADALEQQQQGVIQLPPPTIRTLEQLQEHATAEAVLQAAAAQKPPLVRPVVRTIEGCITVCLPGDPEHPEPRPVLAGTTRIVLDRGRWWAREA